MPVTKSLRWAVIGTGRISESFVPDIQLAGGVVSVVWGRRADAASALAHRFGVASTSTSIDSVLSRHDVDAVYVATPPATHRDLALHALRAGKHVLVEKPMTTSPDASQEIFAAARDAHLFAMEAMWMKFNPLHREVVRLIHEDGLIGDTRYFRGGFGMPFPQGGSRWSAELGGSTVLDQGIYPVTLAEWVMGNSVSLTATGQMRGGVDVAAQITLQHVGGGTSQLACSIVDFVDPSASLSGSAGWVEIPAMFWTADMAQLHAGTREALFESPRLLRRPREGHGYVPMIREVQSAIASGRTDHPWHDAPATLAVARTLDAARAQIRSAM